ncbi:AbrB/MazE/SpoVT family DNA-binding domain-containing protein [Candidatus Woesearchaeota archaeon]|nr:AbrB/MazE/SpoVT family DNA-binding domain-containing protein [Candidatus Woesearchaeota archaeon]
MNVETVRMSSKGQIVIPQDIREEVHVDEGTVFAVVGTKDTIILKKIITPSKEELIQSLKTMALRGRKRAELLGIKESSVPEIVQRVRAEKN